MVRRLITLLVAVLFVFLAVDIVQGFTEPPTSPSTKLIAVDVTTGGQLERFEKSGLPAYASLTGQSGAYLLAGADQIGLSKLRSLGLSYRILDEDVSGYTYYLAFQVPGRLLPRWQDFGKLLLDDGVQVLLRMNETKADHLAALGFEIQKLFMNPIVLWPKDSSDRFPGIADPDPTIQSMMDQVISTTVYQYDGNLSGEWPVTVGGQPYTIVTRYTESGEPIEKATEYVAEHMGNLGLDIEYHVWDADLPPNVIGEMTGETDPDDIFLITAHLDDMPSGDIAPGADDNASGSTAVMIASDIFSQYRWGCTLRFAFFTGEEQGLLGSTVYAQRSSTAGENIVGVLNLDMLGWNTPGSSRTIDLGAESTVPGSVAIANLFSDVIDAYSINLIPQISTSGTCCSDHVPFLNNGYAAILGIEDWSDHTPYYHTTNDLLDSLNLDYFTDFVRASIGTFAHMTSCMIPNGTGSLEGHVSEVEEGPSIEGAEVYMVSDSGSEASATTDSSGYYTTTADIGTYTVTVSAEGYIPATVGDVELLTDTVTTLDFALVPLSKGALDGHVTDAESGAFIAGAAVYLEDGAGWNTTATTDSGGYYTFTLEVGTYTVTVSAENYISATAGGVEVLTDTVTTLDFALVPVSKGALDGYVTDAESGAFIAGAAVYLEDGAGWNTTVTTDGTGYYTATIEIGTYTVTVSAEDYISATVGGVEVQIDSVTTLDFALVPVSYGALDGHVTDADSGAFIAGAAVYLEDGAGWNTTVTTDGTGYYTATIEIGTYTVTVSAENYFSATTGGVEVLTDTVTTLDFALVPVSYGALDGHVTDAESGASIIGASVYIEDLTGWNTTTTTDSGGYYTSTLEVGIYTVTVSAADYISATVGGVEILNNTVSTLDFELFRENYIFFFPIWLHES